MVSSSVVHCPLCDCVYVYLGKHLLKMHGIKNLEERQILLQYARGRINIRCVPCPVKSCNYSQSRLDKHVETAHREMGQEKINRLIKDLKWRVTIKSLKALRARTPSPPMMSRLDIETKDSKKGKLDVATSKFGPEDLSCCTSCKDLLLKHQQLKKHCSVLRKKLRDKIRWSKQAKMTIKKLEEALQKASSGPSESEVLEPAVHEGQDKTSSEKETELPLKLSVFKDFPKFPKSILEYIEEYWVHLKGSCHNKKQEENQRSKVRRIMLFLTFLSEGQKVVWNWMFLHNIKRINEWPQHLVKEGKAIRTIKSYLVNISEFIAYFRDSPPPYSSVPKTALDAVLEALSSSVSKLGRRSILEQIKVEEHNVNTVIPKEDLHTCQKTARCRIPEILDELANDPNPESRRRFFGYISVYLASLYGHRTGVLENMTISEVDEAQQEARVGDEGFVVNVKGHKTNHAFGLAQLYLSVEEFGWLEQWLLIREKLQPSTDLVFFTENNTKINFLIPMQAAWSEMGLSGSPTFTDFRTSIASYAINVISRNTPQQISKTMCRDTATAEKYHSLHLTTSQLAQIRKDFELAINPAQESLLSGMEEAPLLTLSESSSDSEAEDQEHKSKKRKL
ncbi:uncharacterized protein LOC119776066 [Cyprinodon tularosa]|uniref:uncharacterized protein LOC119776066 n=1 Tax=Cyprinodon tularosa TaxID=77115 RepID=UPI0018E24813|nr:uncharacterized protein LOC119776066 [Cyprinodon tularosa]